MIPDIPMPGQSLTREPKAAPYERPPQIVDPEEALDWHLDRLSEDDRKEALVDAAEFDIDVVTLTQGLLRGAVAEGRHSVDVSLLIAPIIHEFICGVLDAAGVDYDEGFEDDSDKREMVNYQKAAYKAKKYLEEHKKTGSISSFDEEEVEEAPKSKGLMSPKSDRMKELEGDL